MGRRASSRLDAGQRLSLVRTRSPADMSRSRRGLASSLNQHRQVGEVSSRRARTYTRLRRELV